ncbi:hypothetical protein PAXRUDRAFT_151314 [Paxillus rubicundulus Ve08.2h10]|uniref:Myb/SANT-like domain-containing protein n=1 Tax=Paxillus rubicundulus Ve08.2h10 TaxID=930991 RepID=A0A0D0E1X0_9AGAM|nr:hypothetical protein PAXRUDRAFT_151314 [Paxillus rubicundulus Ve08.2h10]
MSRLKSSKNSQTSSCSLHSQGPVDLATLNGTGKKTRKPCAKWTTEGETSFVEFLLSQCVSSGDGSNFKKPTFTASAMHLEVKFLNTSGAENMCDVCQGKWTALKAAYNAVVDIKNTLGFTWSDEHGGGIFLKHDDVWDWYAKVCIPPGSNTPSLFM